MSLHMVWGASGSGKSTYVFDEMIRQASERRDDIFLVLVPDQFSQEAQRILVEKSEGAIINIDVLSFHRLAYRALEEVRAQDRIVLADEGKIMLLRKVISEHRGELSVFTKGLDRAGFLDECKSLLSELVEYGVGDAEFDALLADVGEESRLGLKLKDIQLLYTAMKEKMGQTYRMAEEMIPTLTSLVSSLSFLKNVTICLDGFTGFTPVQYELLGELMRVSCDMYVTVTTDRDQIGPESARADVFALSNSTIERLTKTAREYGEEVAEPVIVGAGENKNSYRLTDNKVINYLENNLFSLSEGSRLPLEGKLAAELPDEVYKEQFPIRIRACRRIEDETAFVAREIARLHRDGTDYGRIAVVSGSLTTYEPYIRSVFDKMHIKYFSDQKKSLGTNPLAEYISSFLYAYIYGFDTEHTVRFLRCRLSPLTASETDVFENYIIASGRRGIYAYENEWTYDVNAERMPLDKVNEYRIKIYNSISGICSSLSGGSKKVQEFTEIIYSLLKQNNIYEKLNNLSKEFEEKDDIISSKEYKKLYPSVIRIFDDLVQLLGDEKMTLIEYTKVLLAGISEGVIGFVPPSKDAVLVGDVERSRLSEVDYVFLVGNNDDIFPKGNSAKGVLTDGERTLIESTGVELAPSADKLYEREQFYLYMLLSKPRVGLYLTYAKAESGGESKRPSYLIDKVRDVFGGKLPVIEDDEKDVSVEAAIGTDNGRRYLLQGIHRDEEDDIWKELASYYSEHDKDFYDHISKKISVDKRAAFLSPDVASTLYGSEIYASVTRFEQFMACPYAHYLGYGLRLQERERYVPDPIDRGNIFHNALEAFTGKLAEEGKNWQDLGDAEIESYASESLMSVTDGYKDDIFAQDKRTSYIVKKISKTYTASVKALAEQMKAGEFVQRETEYDFSSADEQLSYDLGDGHKVSLHGRIDRIDTYENGKNRLIKIVDYKSSSRGLSLGEVYLGMQLQLFTYMMVALNMKKDKKNIPAATLYFAVDEKEKDWKAEYADPAAVSETDKYAFRPSGYVNSDVDVYTKLDRELLNAGTKSYAVPISLTSKGTPHASWSKVIPTEAYEKLIEKTKENIVQDGKAIYSGDIQARPAVYGTKGGCEYCAYAGVCGMEPRSARSMERKYDTIKDSEVLRKLNEKQQS